MDEKAFAAFLKKKGKKTNVIERNIRLVKTFSAYLNNEFNKQLEDCATYDITQYVATLESQKKSPKGHLYVLMNYFKFTGNKELLKCAATLRQKRTEKSRSVFLLKNFMHVDQEYVKVLANAGIKNVDDMLKAGNTKIKREMLSQKLNIPEDSILELVKLSDITRLGYVKTKLTRLYYNAGLDSPQKIAAFKPEELHTFFVKFVKESGWDGMVPNLKDLVGNIASARKLKKVVQE
ncbi:MAG: DUF4332 domain-containing protein [Candidatus Cloacimonetes bacterium]|nr:DUF4332 domain-containing protein [Candidatus Cloacimonadota bacterium]